MSEQVAASDGLNPTCNQRMINETREFSFTPTRLAKI